MQRANLSPIYSQILFLKGSHLNFKIGNVHNGPNPLLLLKLILNTNKDNSYYIYGILRKLNSLSNQFSNKSRIVKSRAGMILKSKLILALNNFESGNSEHLFWGVVIPSIISQTEESGRELIRIPFGGYFLVKKNEINLRQYCIFPNPSTCRLTSCISCQPFQFNTLVLG